MQAICRQEELLQSQQSEEAGSDSNHGPSGRFLQIGNETYSLSALHPYMDLDVEEDEHHDNSDHGYEFEKKISVPLQIPATPLFCSRSILKTWVYAQSGNNKRLTLIRMYKHPF